MFFVNSHHVSNKLKLKLKANLAHVDASHLVPLGVPVAELGHRGDGVKAGILRQCEGNHLQRVAVGSHAVRLHAAKGA